MNQLSASLRSGIEAMIALLEPLGEEAFFLPEKEGKWSAAELVTHIYELDRFILKVLQGPAIAAERPIDQQLSMIGNAFGDLERGLSAPPVTLKMNNKAQLLEELRKHREAILQWAISGNTQLIYTRFTHNRFGQLSGLEWLHFLNEHTARHLHQAKRITLRWAQN